MNVNWNGYASAVIRDTASDPTVVLENWSSVVAAGTVLVRLRISSECAVQKKHVWSVVKVGQLLCSAVHILYAFWSVTLKACAFFFFCVAT